MSNRFYYGLRSAYDVACGKYAGDIGHAVFVNHEKTSESGCDLCLFGESACRALTDSKDNAVSLDVVTGELL